MGAQSNLKIAGIVVAGGRSTRFGRDKLAEKLDDKSVLAWSTSLLSLYSGVGLVVLGTDSGKQAKELIAGHCASNVIISEAGSSRGHTIANALMKVPSEYELILIHDGARPLASKGLIERLVQNIEMSGCVVPIMPVSGAVKSIKNKYIDENIERKLFTTQTPQLVYARPLRYAIKKFESALSRFRDTASLMSEFGISVATVHGESANIKITYKEDLRMAEAFVESGLYRG